VIAARTGRHSGKLSRGHQIFGRAVESTSDASAVSVASNSYGGSIWPKRANSSLLEMRVGRRASARARPGQKTRLGERGRGAWPANEKGTMAPL